MSLLVPLLVLLALGGDVLGVPDALPWVVGVLVIVPFTVLLIVLQVLRMKGLIHHV